MEPTCNIKLHMAACHTGLFMVWFDKIIVIVFTVNMSDVTHSYDNGTSLSQQFCKSTELLELESLYSVHETRTVHDY